MVHWAETRTQSEGRWGADVSPARPEVRWNRDNAVMNRRPVPILAGRARMRDARSLEDAGEETLAGIHDVPSDDGWTGGPASEEAPRLKCRDAAADTMEHDRDADPQRVG